MTGGFPSRDTISSKDVVSESGPLRNVAIASFDKRVMNCAVGTFDNTIGRANGCPNESDGCRNLADTLNMCTKTLQWT